MECVCVCVCVFSGGEALKHAVLLAQQSRQQKLCQNTQNSPAISMWHTCTHARTHARTHTHTHTHTHCSAVELGGLTHTHTHSHTHTHRCIITHQHNHTYTHTHISA